MSQVMYNIKALLVVIQTTLKFLKTGSNVAKNWFVIRFLSFVSIKSE